MARLRQNLSTGLWWGIRYAMVYSLVGGTIAIARPAVLESYGLTLPGLIALYLGGGIGGGALTGLLLPLVRGHLSAAVVGFIVSRLDAIEIHADEVARMALVQLVEQRRIDHIVWRGDDVAQGADMP